MRALLLTVLLAWGCTACAAEPRWYEAQSSPSPKALRWNLDVIVRDPLTTSMADIEDLHQASKRVVCRLGPIQPSDPDSARPGPEAMSDRLKLCRDKGFDAVAFTVPTDTLVREARQLKLPVLELPLAPRTEE